MTKKTGEEMIWIPSVSKATAAKRFYRVTVIEKRPRIERSDGTACDAHIEMITPKGIVRKWVDYKRLIPVAIDQTITESN